MSFSGGLDSTVLLSEVVKNPSTVVACSFNYGQRHARELTSAKAIAALYEVETRVPMLGPLLSGSALLGAGNVPDGHYAAESMTATVINGRNLLFIAALVAQTVPGDTVWVGVHAGDHFIYGDCRPAFIHPLAAAIFAAYEVTLNAPFLDKTKTQIVETGTTNKAPLNLSWSCYKGGEKHCGRCGTCVERRESFHLAGVEDPTEYEDPDYWRTVV